MDPITEYGTQEYPVHKSDFTPCPMASYYNVLTRLSGERPRPTLRMLQGSVIDRVLRIALGPPLGQVPLSQKAIGLLYEWFMISEWSNTKPKGKLESKTTIEEAIVNYRNSCPASPGDGWPFTSHGGFSNCHFKFQLTNTPVWVEGTLDQLALTGSEVIVLDWKLAGASQFSGYEALIYTEATATRMVSTVTLFKGCVGEDELLASHGVIMTGSDGSETFIPATLPSYTNMFEDKEIVVELHQPASRFFQVSLINFVKYKRRTRTGKVAGDYKGPRFHENPMTNMLHLKACLMSAVEAIAQGKVWTVETINCWNCLHNYRCFDHSPSLVEGFEIEDTKFDA